MDSDFLIIGSGIAGLSFALRAAKLGKVVIITKKSGVDTATNLAQGGIAAVISKMDSFDLHIKDTLESGAGLCDEKIVEMVVKGGPEQVYDLIKLGVDFERGGKGEEGDELSLGKEGGHSRRRVVHAHDLTGREIEKALLKRAREDKNIQLLENHICVDLLMIPGEVKGAKRRCVGAYVLQDDGDVHAFRSKLTVLCTGGSGKVYLYTSNPDIATGDGVAMAFRAGAKVANLEFVQFHPTCLFHHDAKNFLISEAVRGEGAILVDSMGNRFMEKYDPARMELSTRDTVARAIDQEMKESGKNCVYLDISHKEKGFIKERFPGIYAKCLEFGIDITRDKIPVVPAAHYQCGGVLTDSWGRSSIDGLLALGETACTGLHGANRLASNSLLEAVVYAERAHRFCKKNWPKIEKQDHPMVDGWKEGVAKILDEEILIHHNWDQIRRIMWNYVGIVRREKRLLLAQQRILEIQTEIEQHYRDYYVTTNMVELRNIAQVAALIISASLYRKESRGLHYILDYPSQHDEFRHWTVLKKTRTGSKGVLGVVPSIRKLRFTI